MHRGLVQQPWEQRDPWEQPDPVREGDDSDSEGEEATGAAAGEALCDLLVSLLLAGSLSAKNLCCICWFASRAGALGPVSEFALRPSSQTGKFQAKVDRTLGFDLKSHNFYKVDTPGHSRREASRVKYEVPMRLPHEVVDEYAESVPDLHDNINSAVLAGDLPRSHQSNPVVLTAGLPVLPLALFIDGVRFLVRSSMIGVFIACILTGKRTLSGLSLTP